MFGFSFGELLIVLIISAIVLDVNDYDKIIKTFARLFRKYHFFTRDVRRSIMTTVNDCNVDDIDHKIYQDKHNDIQL